ncbi:MAG: MFS transporter [Rubrobacter sp.]|nr:MFS transporter [Rubrobacter sp.]
MEVPAELGGRLRLLRAAAFLSTFDRFTIAPMLVTIAADLDVSLAEVAVAASTYFLLYGLMQPVWGMLSDRIGRVTVIRLTLVAVLVPGLLSAFAPNLATLIVGRALAGGLFAAIIPASLVYIGDTVPISTRQKALADQLATSAVATALATVTAGIAAYLDLWRLAFAAPVLASATLGLLFIRRLPEPEHGDGDAGILARLVTVFRKPWALLVVLFALIEGGVILGFLTYLAPALENQGFSSAASGLAVGLYGVATLVWTRILKRVSDRVGAHVLLIMGGALLVAGYAAGALEQNLIGISLAAVFVGGGFAFMHSTLQTWATEVVPEARATMISLFAAALFTGSGLATSAAAPLAQDDLFSLLFTIAALIALPLGLIAGFSRRRYGRK